jgi:hypothetical protein
MNKNINYKSFSKKAPEILVTVSRDIDVWKPQDVCHNIMEKISLE